MSEGMVNWGELMNAAAEAFQPVPKGVYTMVVDKCDAKTASTGKAMWAILFKIEGGPHDGRTVYYNLVLTTEKPVALRMFFLNMKALGMEQQFFASNPTPQQIATALVGRRAQVTIDHREYMNQMRENVKSLKAATGGVFSSGTVPTPGIPGVPAMGAPVPTSAPAPQPPQASPSIPAPAYGTPPPAPVAPPATPPATPPTESTIPIPPPVAPVPEEQPVVPDEPMEQGNPTPFPEEDVPANVEEDDVKPQLPPGMTPEMFAQFLAFQASQKPATPENSTTTTPAAPFPAGAVPPPTPF